MKQSKKKLSVGVLASGSGTDLQSIIDASESGLIDAKVVVVISDRSDAYALSRAKKHQIPGFFVNPDGKDRAGHESEIDTILRTHQVELLIGAGYMRLLSPSFVKKWYGRLINIHPALLPSFKGTNGQRDALEYGVKLSGCTTHFMDTEMDHGPIILQAAVKVHAADDRDALANRILAVEHRILPRTVQLFAQNRLHIEGRRVIILPGDSWKKKHKVFPDVLYSEGY
ncbi:MAG: phosphoribosylglycinamide formyltransferase [Thermoplasmata archaeon M11B2D]|nr:MAG: phosphoribosylglycinamide formyltransferase [Thermoplasmata archaeon M11B2D]PNX54044.1 MAG: phosphoribosylglycinamide formyltransferase [Thermoplasmata archaeon M9B2D]